MHNIFRLALVSFLSVSFVGCASMPGGGNPNRPALSSDTKASALKGCGIGAVAGAAFGLIRGGGISSALKFGAGGCAVGGVTGGVIGYRSQLKEAAALADAAKAQGLNPTVTTRTVQPTDSKGEAEAGLERLVLPLNAEDVRNHGAQTKALLEKGARIVSGDTTGQHITVTLAGSPSDRAWMRGVMSPVAGNAATFAEVEASTPRIELSPVPTVAAAPASGFDARTGTWTTGKGGH